jgi:hypothetical protein
MMVVNNEIEILQHLTQQGAAWLAGCDARTLRDFPFNRDEQGRYDGRDVVKFARGRLKPVELDDDEEEKLLLVAETIAADAPAAVGEFLGWLSAEHGDGGLAMFARRLLAEIRECGYEQHGDVTRSEEQEAIADLHRQRAHQRLKLAVVCEDCRKLRRGSRWIKGKPPEGYHAMRGKCPSCA